MCICLCAHFHFTTVLFAIFERCCNIHQDVLMWSHYNFIVMMVRQIQLSHDSRSKLSVSLSEWLTNDVASIISNEGLAVNVDQLCDKWLGELRMCPQATECDVLCPLFLNWEIKPGGMIQERWYKNPVKMYENKKNSCRHMDCVSYVKRRWVSQRLHRD